MKRFIAALAVATSLFAVAPAFAQDAGTSPVATAEAKSTLSVANAMITSGRSNADPLAMIAGVQMMVSAAEGTTIESAGTPVDLGAILDEAVALAPEDALILARADTLRDAAETKTRGACYWEYWCDYYGYCEYWYVCY